MSTETSLWLNTHTLIGFTDARGSAWHYRAEDQGDISNHYAGAIPVEDVLSRLFFWEPVEGEVSTTYVTEDGVTTLLDRDRKAIIRPQGTWGPEDKGEILGLFKSGYQPHSRKQWLLDNVSVLLDDDLQVGSAGELKGGAVAWVQVEMPETIDTPEGVSFRPFMSSATSFDGSLSSTYMTGAQLIVCDNTLSAALGDQSALRIKIKHSRNSIGKISDVREALGIVHKVAEDFAAEVKALCETTVTDAEWFKFLEALTPTAEKEGRGLTMARNKQDDLNRLWKQDERVSPWKNTAFGVLQAVNTHAHHFQTVKGASRAERNALRAITGGIDALDNGTLNLLSSVLVGA